MQNENTLIQLGFKPNNKGEYEKKGEHQTLTVGGWGFLRSPTTKRGRRNGRTLAASNFGV